ncbi:VirB4 family type IV secretion/conjugal transfer ATPase, partial [Faecalimonas sp.]
LTFFKSTLENFEDKISSVLYINRLKEYELELDHNFSITQSDLFTHINQCITGEFQSIQVPKIPMYLDSILGNEDFIGGFAPKIGNKFIRTISIDGFPQESFPCMLSIFDTLPFEFRFNTRFLCLDNFDAVKETEKYVKSWNSSVLGFFDKIFNNPNPKINQDAIIMKTDAEEVKLEVQSNDISVGYMTSTIIILDEEENSLEEKAREIRRVLQNLGFTCRFETINAIEAYLGSLPGNTYANLRRPLIKTNNLADLLPLSTVYVGEMYNPCPFYPQGSRPLAVFTTDNTTPFWFNIHNGDIGHTLMLGPTGAGKSTFIALLVAQFRGYKNAQIFAFDKGNSLLPLCYGANGSHYEIGVNDELCFCPLQNIDESPAEMAFCEEWIAMLLELQSYKLTPKAKNEIHNAMENLATQPKNMRSITNFIFLVQDIEIKEALNSYSRNGVYKNLIDSDSDTLGLSSFIVFEMEEIMNMGDKILIPILTYIFHRIEKALKGQPSLLVLDEAWIMLGHPVFRAKIREWLKVLRKANCAVFLATQSLSDIKNSGIMDVLVESCPTKILLPNANAIQEEQYKLYKDIGLNDREIETLSRYALPKKDYYIINSYGRRLVQLALEKKTLAFVGASDKESIARIKELRAEDNNNWQDRWIAERVR